MLDDILLFTTLVEVGNYRKAAEKMRLSQPTLSRKIVGLEEFFGKQLFLRDSRNIELTEDGKIVYESCKHYGRFLADLTKKVQYHDRETENLVGELRVLLPYLLSYNAICPYIHIFVAENPNVKLQLQFAFNPSNIRENKYDIVLMHHDIEDAMYNKTFVRKEFCQLYCRPEYAKRYGVPLNLNDLYEHSVIGFIDIVNYKPLEWVKFINKYTKEEWFYDNNRTSLRLNSPIPLMIITKHMDFIFPNWTSFGEQEIAKGNLIPILPEYYVYETSFFIYSKRRPTNIEQAFVEFLYKCLNKSITLD